MTTSAEISSLSNLYRMLCYAWRRTDAKLLHAAEAASFHRVEELCGFLLSRAVKELLRKGVARGYRELSEERRAPKGRFLATETMKRQLRLRGRAACAFDEWDADVLPNRILRAALTQLEVTLASSHPAMACDLRALGQRFREASPILLSPACFHRLTLSPGQRHYSLALDICAFLANSCLPSAERTGAPSFVDPRSDEQRMGWVFETFVRRYLEVHLTSGPRVLPDRRLDWALSSASAASNALIPRMETDLRIATPNGLSVVEVKCARDALPAGRDGKRRLRPAHLYQLHAYASHLAQAGLDVTRAILLIGSSGSSFSHHYRMGNVDWLVVAVDLQGPWHAITAGVDFMAHGHATSPLFTSAGSPADQA